MIHMSEKPTYEELLKRVLELEKAELERKQNSEALHRSQVMLARTERISHIGSWEWEIATDTVTWSDELFRIFQLDPDEKVPSWAEHSALYHPEDMESLRHAVEASVADGTPYELELRALRKDGEIRVCLACGFAEMGHDGRATRLFGSLQDITERKRAEEALQESKLKAEQYLNVAAEIIISLNRQGNITLLNDNGHKLLGYDPGELIGKNWFKTCLPEDAESEVSKAFNRLMNDAEIENVKHFENKVKTKEGLLRDVFWHNTLLRDAECNVIGLLSSGEDITERKQAEEALKRIEWMLSTTPSSSHAEDLTDSDGDQGYGDLTALNHGGHIAEAIDKHVLHSIASEYLDMMGTSSAIYEKNGDYAYGIFSSFWCRLLDRASRELCHTEDNRTALECGKWLCHESCWTICSKQAIEMRAPMDIECNGGIRLYAVPIFAGEEVIGAINFGYGDPPKDLAKLRAIADSYGLDLEELIREASNYDPRPHFIIEMAKRRLQVSARLIGILVERKWAEKEKTKLESRLIRAQKMESIGSLAGGIAHDLNNILFPISGLSEMLLDGIPPDTHEHKSIEQIHKSAKRGSDLVKQILFFSRQSNPQKLPIRIQPILKEALKLAQATIPRNIEVKSHISTDCGMILVDPTQIHQIAMNLITNAFHAVEKTGGMIDIALKETAIGSFDEKEDLPFHAIPGDLLAGRYACITVSDTGTGIDQALIDKIFDPYFTTKELGKGTGLGLSVVHGIVKEHGGDIRVYSEVGKGTVFHVYLPLLEDAMDSKTAAITRKYPTGHERILLVDDEEPILRVEQMMLERLGYQVTTRMSSPDALAAFKANPGNFDLVISDRGMPNMTGDQLAAELISIKPGIPIILCTGFSNDNDVKRAKAMGVKGFLMKPVAIGDLAEMVRNVIDEVTDRVLAHDSGQVDAITPAQSQSKDWDND